jgi:two-component system sensor histidine kinase RegB
MIDAPMSEGSTHAPGLSLRVGFPWLWRLRWVSLFGQLLTLGFSTWALGLSPPILLLLGLVSLGGLSNLWLWQQTRKGGSGSELLVASALLADTLILTVLLAFTGGTSNPFSVLYLVQVTWAAVILGPRWAWVLVALSAVGYGLLFLLPGPAGHAGHEHFPMHLQGMWLAFAVTASMIAYFVARLSQELRQRESEVAALQKQAAVNDKLASLSTLAAGAAHELGTPLATIALAAGELVRATQGQGGGIAEDAALIRGEVQRCRQILWAMAAEAGETRGEALEPVATRALLDSVRLGLGEHEVPRLRVEVDSALETLRLPRQAFLQVLQSLVRNSFDASGDERGEVVVRLRGDAAHCRFEVEDQGEGMAPETLARAGEPFFTTKPPGQGMGLGLFLARTVTERLGGSMSLRSVPRKGTTVVLELPRSLA